MNPKKTSRYLKFISACFHLSRQAVPEYKSKFSKHTFTQHQHVVLNCLKIKLNLPYRDFVELLEEMPKVKETLRLKQVPHFTTIQKAFNRLSTIIWRLLLKMSTKLFQRRSSIVGIDASDYERHYASHYYTRRAKLKISSIKTTILVELMGQIVLDVHLTTTRRHDTQIAPKLLLRNQGSFHVLIGDKGYDDHKLRSLLKGMMVKALIKHREYKPYHKAANARLDKGLLSKRCLVESVISVVKRKYGGWVRSRSWEKQFREIVVKHLIYNIERAISFLAFLLCLFKLARKRISTELKDWHCQNRFEKF